MRVYLVLSEIPALMVVITCYTRSQGHASEGYASTNKYTETTSIRNNLLGILIPEINIFGKKKLSCYEWQPAKPILTQAKSATYKNLQARKKQKQA